MLHRALDLRRRRPHPFGGAHQPLDAPEGIVAYLRGGEVAVAVAVRPGVEPDVALLPAGTWHDELGVADLDLGVGLWARDPEELR
ncbi:MAG: hypothetical protein U0P45_13925 [Acidimicrobiales bacterium]